MNIVQTTKNRKNLPSLVLMCLMKKTREEQYFTFHRIIQTEELVRHYMGNGPNFFVAPQEEMTIQDEDFDATLLPMYGLKKISLKNCDFAKHQTRLFKLGSTINVSDVFMEDVKNLGFMEDVKNLGQGRRFPFRCSSLIAPELAILVKWVLNFGDRCKPNADCKLDIDRFFETDHAHINRYIKDDNEFYNLEFFRYDYFGRITDLTIGYLSYRYLYGMCRLKKLVVWNGFIGKLEKDWKLFAKIGVMDKSKFLGGHVFGCPNLKILEVPEVVNFEELPALEELTITGPCIDFDLTRNTNLHTLKIIDSDNFIKIVVAHEIKNLHIHDNVTIVILE